MDAYTEFARQGYKGEDLSILANTGLVAANVAEMTAQEASEYVTSALAQWKMETSESMKIIDAWNAISNNYATTVEKIAKGQSVAASTAKSMGISFDQLNAIIGTVTATTKQSGSEIGRFIKNSLPRLVSDKGMKALSGLGINLTDDSGNLRDVVEVYTEVANALKGMSEIDSIKVVEALAGKEHISRMQALLNDLGRADSMYRKMYDTSSTSAGSASAENEKYMQSLQARINLLRVEVEELALALGEAFLTEGMIGFMKVASETLQALTKLTSSVGALPVILGLGAATFVLLSSRAKSFGSALATVAIEAGKTAIAKKRLTAVGAQYRASLDASVASTKRFTIATASAGASVRTLTTTKATASAMQGQFASRLAQSNRTVVATTTVTKTLTASVKSLGFAFATMVPFAVLGIVIEQLMKASEKARELRENAESSSREMMTSYKSNREEIDSLVASYENLEGKINSGNYDNSTLNEYYDIQNKIGTLLPTLVTGEDQYGRKLIESSSAVGVKVGLLEQQLALEKEMAEWKAKQDRDERIEGNKEAIKENTKMMTQEMMTAFSDVFDKVFYKDIFHDIPDEIRKIKIEDFDSLDKINDYLSKISEARKIAERNGNSELVKFYNELAQRTSDAANQIKGYGDAINQAQSANRIDFISKLNEAISENSELTDKAKGDLQEFSTKLMELSDVKVSEDLNNGFNKLFTNADNNSFVLDLIKDFNSLDKATGETFNSVVNKIESSMDSIKKSLKNSGLSDTEIDAVMDTLSEKIQRAKVEFDKLEPSMKKTGVTLEEAIANSAIAASDSIDELVDKAEAFKDAIDDLTGNISNINGILEDYAENNKLSASAMLEIITEYPELIAYINDESQLIKELTKIRDKDIVEAKKQILEKLSMNKDYYNQNVKLLEQYVEQNFKFYNGDLKQFQTLAQAKADIEVQLINELAKKWGVYYNEQLKSFSMYTEKGMSSTSFGFTVEGANSAIQAQKELNNFYNKFDDFSLSRINIDFKSIGTSLNKASSSSSKSSKDKAKADKQSIYITDKYKQALEELNAAIEKQNKLQNDYPKHSAQYRSALQNELKLQKQKLKLIQDQAKALDAQIKSGKIAQTGSVSDPKYGTTTTSKTSSVKVNGWGGSLTSKQGNRTNPVTGKSEYHNGIDLSGKLGTRLDANYAGKVIASGAATKNGYHSSYGNIVVVQDGSGNKHLYAHLEKAVAKIGEYIQAGTQVGTIGKSGTATGSHLHYNVQNSKGQHLDAATFAKQARSGTVSVSQQVAATSTAISTTQQSIDEAKSTLLSLQTDVLNQQEKIAEIEQAIITSYFDYFEYRRKSYDDHLSHESAKLKTLTRDSDRYNKTLELMTNYMNQKQKVNSEELAYIEGLIKKGGLTAVVLDELNQRKLALKTSIHELNNEIQKFNLDRITEQYEDLYNTIDNTIEFEESRLSNLNETSERYTKTLETLADKYEDKYDAVLKNIKAYSKLISSGKLNGEVLKEAKDKVNDLKVELQNLHNQITTKNYEIVVNIKTKYDEKIDDKQFELNYSQKVQSKYEEGTANYNDEIKKQISIYEEMAKMYDESRRKIQAEMKQKKLTAEQVKDLTEQMEDLSLSYMDAITSIDSLNKSLEDSRKQMLNDIADAYINAYKEYVQERQDEHMKLLDDELEREQERHDKIMKQYRDEMDLFRKNVQEKLDLIDRQEAQRSYDMDMDDLEKDRKEIVDKINLLSIDDSYEAKKKRTDLLKQLDAKDKEIAEKKHARDIELQKQALNDLVDMKESEIEQKEELEDEQYNKVVKSIDRQKEYWQKHYTDLLNDERKFAQIREDILNGHFDKVNAEFQQYINEMVATMPKLEDTLDGTMKAVGTSIRQNVIDNLREAMKLVEEYQAKQNSSSPVNKDKWQDDFNPNAPKEDLGEGNLIENMGDVKVVVGKYMADVLSRNETSAVRKKSISDKAHDLAAEGRAEGSTIPKFQHVDKALSGFSDADKKQIKQYVNANANNIFISGYLQDALRNWAASLDTGGYMNWSGAGIDGKGGKAIIAHPEEVMLNKVQTKNLLDTIQVSDQLTSNLATLMNSFTSLMKGMSPTFSMNGGYGDVNVNLTGDIYTESKNSVNEWANKFGDAMRRNKGGW